MTMITALMDLSKFPNQSQDQATFDANWAYVLENMGLRGQQENALAANLNTIAAGGAYAIAYRWGISVNGSSGYLAGGVLSAWGGDSAVQPTLPSTTKLAVDARDLSGAAVATLLNTTVSGNASAIKGHIRLVKLGDPSRWARFSVTSYAASNQYYGYFDVVHIDASSPSAFAPGDTVLMFFQRTGDKGDKGDNGNLLAPTFYVREEQVKGVGAGLNPSGVSRRVLNTIKLNTIPGASLANNLVTVPAGTYNIFGRAPGYNCGIHRVALWDVTSGSLFEVGSSEQAGATQTNSYVEVRNFTMGSPRTFELQHFTAGQSSNGLGFPSNQFYNEVYAQLLFEKVG